MSVDETDQAAHHDAGAYKQRRRPPNNPEFAMLVSDTRGKVGMTQTELARAAGVSPRSIAQIEKEGSARADVIIRVAAAMGQRPEDWLKLAGHPASPERVGDVLRQRKREKSTPHFARMNPIKEFERMRDRVKKHKATLMCSFVTSGVQVENKDVMPIFMDMFSHGLHLAVICPYPIAVKQIANQRTRLNRYYGDANSWAVEAATALRNKLPDEQKRQVSVFSPRHKESTILVIPPIRVSELRPAFIRYGLGIDDEFEGELGAYIRFLDGRDDQWIEVYGGEGETDDRTDEAFHVWRDYCADILDCWTPGEKSASTFDDDNLLFWERHEGFRL